jgi:hypothetical protein
LQLFISLKLCSKVVSTTVIAKDMESLISILSNMDRATGATAPVPTTTIPSVMPFSSTDKMGPYKDWKAEVMCSSAEAVQRVAVSLEGVHDVRGIDVKAAAVLDAGQNVTYDVLQEKLEDGAGLLVHDAADALDTTTASETVDTRPGDALDAVTQDFATQHRLHFLAATLGAVLSQALGLEFLLIR